MANERTFTVQQIINSVIYTLENINVPVRCLDSVAKPIKVCVANLTECVHALDEAAQKKNVADASREAQGDEAQEETQCPDGEPEVLEEVEQDADADAE